MNKPIIAVDIDEVLSDGAESFVRFSNEKWDTNLTVDDYQEHWSEMWQVDHEETERRAEIWHASGTMFRNKIKTESVMVLTQLMGRYELVITTSRRLAQKDGTLAWVQENYADIFNAVHFAGIYDAGLKEVKVYEHTKADLYRDIKASYVIDDQLKHCLAASELGLTSILFGDYKWNHTVGVLPANVIRCKDWLAVLEYFDAR